MLTLRATDPTRPPRVCFYSFHPLVFQEVGRLLKGGFRVQARQIDSEDTQGLGAVPIPRAAAYLVDGHGRRSVTENAVAAILSQHPSGRVVVMAEKLTETNAFPLLRLGVKGLVTYGENAQLPRVLREVAAGAYWVPRSLLSRFVETTLAGSAPRRIPPAARDLTRRESEVLEGLLENLSNKEIAVRLRISERTAKFHVSNLLAKYSVRRRADLILLNFSKQSEG